MLLSDGIAEGEVECWCAPEEEVCGDPEPAGEGRGPPRASNGACRGSGGMRSRRPRSPSGTEGSSHVSRAEPKRLAGVGPAIGVALGIVAAVRPGTVVAAAAVTAGTAGAAGEARADGKGVFFFVDPSGRPGFLCTYVKVQSLSCFRHARHRSVISDGVHFTCCQRSTVVRPSPLAQASPVPNDSPSSTGRVRDRYRCREAACEQKSQSMDNNNGNPPRSAAHLRLHAHPPVSQGGLTFLARQRSHDGAAAADAEAETEVDGGMESLRTYEEWI